jgi:phosphohistidine phosphatase
MAEHLRRKGIAPELVLCSPSRRTRQTLTRIAPGLGENADVQIESELYAASAADLIEVLHGVPDEVESVMLIGHNPGIQDLALSLARGGSEIARVRSKFPTAALATLELNGSWRELAPGSAELMSLVKPKELSRGAAGGP